MDAVLKNAEEYNGANQKWLDTPDQFVNYVEEKCSP